MDRNTKQKLEAAGWVVGDTARFLGLADAASAFIHMKLGLASELKERRLAQGLSQTQVAKMVGSSQSRVARMEAADPSVSAELLIQTLLELGASRKEVAQAVSAPLAGAR